MKDGSRNDGSRRVSVQKALIDGVVGKIEVEALWQNENPADDATDTIALICHPNPLDGGSMTNKVVTTMHRYARDKGMHSVRFNFRCAGKSEGKHDFGEGEVEDAMTVLQWVHQQTQASKIWLAGFSFGGYVTLRVAEQLDVTPHIWGLTELQIKKIVLIAPSIEKNDTSDLILPANKTMMIYGDEDNVIKPSSMNEFAQRFVIEAHVINGAGHLFHGYLIDIKTLLEQHA